MIEQTGGKVKSLRHLHGEGQFFGYLRHLPMVPEAPFISCSLEVLSTWPLPSVPAPLTPETPEIPELKIEKR